MPEYFLASGVYYCSREDALVFFDLKRDEYSMLNGNSASALRALTRNERYDSPNSDYTQSLQEMLEGGLLTTDRCSGRPIAPTIITMARNALVDPEARRSGQIDTSRVYNFMMACLSATLRLRLCKIENIARRIERRKKARATLDPIDMASARDLTATFLKLRSFYPRNYLCLYDSLALIEFLARYQVFPNWVFGIKLEPWAAHCWVQESTYVFNEGIEEVAKYTPIVAL